MIRNSDGHKYPIKPNFNWKMNTISERDFLSIADTGDMLLFRGNERLNTVTRAVQLS